MYNKDEILKNISKDIKVIMIPEGKLYNCNISIKERLNQATEIDGNKWSFINCTFYFGSNNEAIAKELSSKARRQNNILLIKELYCYEQHVEIILGEDIFELIKQDFK
jgi:hypothetical protein